MITGAERYYFLFGLALVWIIFGTIVDFKKREVPNWINFSLLAFALAYRAFYATATRDLWFFLFGVIGAGVFFALALGLYYTKVFGGGDAKLLIALGAVLPFETFRGLGINAAGFLFILFAIGGVYNLVYGLFLAGCNWRSFKIRFAQRFNLTAKIFAALSLLIGILIWRAIGGALGLMALVLIVILPWISVYLRALEISCMIKLKNARDLAEGDWLERDVSVGGHVIRKSVHGLNAEEIKILRKAGKKVLIKEGVPFTIVFLIALMVFFYLALSRGWTSVFSSLA